MCHLRKLLLYIAVVLIVFSSASAVQAEEVKLHGYKKDGGYQYIYMGAYPQREDGQVAHILWRVLFADDDYALLLSEFILFNHNVHADFKEYEAFEGQFNLTDIYRLLNEEFIHTAFSETEQQRLITTEELGTVFLISGEDLKNKDYGFTSNASRQGFGTPYALANGLFRYSANGRKSSPFWTRSRSTTLASGVRCTKVDGSIGYIRCVVEDEGVRPAVMLELNNGKAAFISGDGSAESPFLVEKK